VTETTTLLGPRGRATIAIAVALSLVAAAVLGLVVGLWLNQKGNAESTAPTGPEAIVTILETNASGLRLPVVSANVTVFSVVPVSLGRTVLGWNLSQYNPWSNPFYIELGSAITGSNGVARVVLAPTFDAIIDEWRSTALPPTLNVSIQVDASYLLTTGSNVSYYHDFGELSFSPLSVPGSLNLTMVGNLSEPAWTGPLPTDSTETATSGCASLPSATWTPESISVEPGVLPLGTLLDHSMQTGNDTLGVSDAWGTFANARIGLGGVEAQIAGPIDASIQPSWSGVYSDFGFEDVPAVSVPGPGTDGTTTVAEVYLSGVIFVVVVMTEVFHWQPAGSCSGETLRFQYVTAWVAQATTLLPECEGAVCSDLLASRELSLGPTDFLDGQPDRELANQSLLAPGTSEDQSSIVPGWTEYAQAMKLTGVALGTSLVYASSIGEAVLISDLMADCAGNCTDNVSATLLSEASIQFGPAFAVIPSLASLDSVVAGNITQGPSVQAVQYTNTVTGPGNAVELFEYVGEEPTYIDLDGTSVGFNAPELGPWACPVGTSPGNGC
jgi:hypothetical protein